MFGHGHFETCQLVLFRHNKMVEMMKVFIFTFLSSVTAFASVASNPDTKILTKAIAVALDCANRSDPHDSAYGPSLDFKERHPAFFGCWDYHASVFNHWALLRVVNEWPDRPERQAIVALLAEHFSKNSLIIESENLRTDLVLPLYETAWVLRLADEIRRTQFPEAKNWSQDFAPLEQEALTVFQKQLTMTTVPDRSPLHSNTAYALIHALDYADNSNQMSLAELIRKQARLFFIADRNCQAPEEATAGPGAYVGAQFISPCFTEADLMRRVLTQDEYLSWHKSFFPTLPEEWLQPLIPINKEYGHYRLGLMLSKAAQFRGIARTACESRLLAAADVQTSTAAETMFDQDYMGDHWLPAFYIYSLMHFGP